MNAEPQRNGSTAGFVHVTLHQMCLHRLATSRKKRILCSGCSTPPAGPERPPVGLLQIALWFADATAWQLESRQTHGTCISVNTMDEESLFGASLALDDPADVWCLPPAPMWWANMVLLIRDEFSKASRELAPRFDFCVVY